MLNSYLLPFISTIILAFAGCKKKDDLSASVETITTVDSTQIDTLSKIIINLNGIKNAKGKINSALYNSSSSFNNPSQSYKKYSLNAVSGNLVITLDSIPSGTYAFGLYHDENGNNEIDKNLLGIPPEGFAFSNNAMGAFGPPSFQPSNFF